MDHLWMHMNFRRFLFLYFSASLENFLGILVGIALTLLLAFVKFYKTNSAYQWIWDFFLNFSVFISFSQGFHCIFSKYLLYRDFTPSVMYFFLELLPPYGDLFLYILFLLEAFVNGRCFYNVFLCIFVGCYRKTLYCFMLIW